MALRIDPLAISLPGIRAVRWSSDALHVGLKEAYTIARVESGYSDWWSGGQRWTSSPGSVQIQGPGDVCRDVPRGASTRQVITLPANVVESVAGRVRFDPQLEAGDARGLPFQRLHDAVQCGADRLALEVAVAEVIAAFADLSNAKSDLTRPVRRAMDLLRGSVDAPLTLDRLAEHAGIDKFRLCRAFRAQVGLPPHAYLIRLRILRAKELLAGGVRPAQVASQVGFCDQSQLNRHFLRIVGTTPGQYARSTGAIRRWPS